MKSETITVKTCSCVATELSNEHVVTLRELIVVTHEDGSKSFQVFVDK